MKTTITALAIIASTFAFSQVGIGTNAPSSKSILDLTATDKGFLLPRMTTAQRTAIAPNATTDKGMQVFDTTTNTIWFWNGIAWVEGDTTNDAFVNNTSSARVELGAKSDGTARTAGTQFAITDEGKVGIGAAPDAIAELLIATGPGQAIKILPQDLTDPSGSTRMQIRNNQSKVINFGMTNSGGAFAGVVPANTAFLLTSGTDTNLILGTDNTPKITVFNDGKMGIGTIFPSQAATASLDIDGGIRMRTTPVSSTPTRKGLFVELDGSVVSGTSISKVEAIDILAKSLTSNLNITAEVPPNGYATQGTEVELTSLTTPFTTTETLSISVNALVNFGINVAASMSSPWQGQINVRVYLNKGTANEKSVVVTQESMKFLGGSYANDYTIPINALFENITAGSHVLSFTVQRANETQTDPGNPFGFATRPVTPSPSGYLISRASYNALIFKRL